ncbi:hypothetical protein ACFQ36_22090 [Arthrobacter sp. GCM10027362]
MLPVPLLRRDGDLEVTDVQAQLLRISSATIASSHPNERKGCRRDDRTSGPGPCSNPRSGSVPGPDDDAIPGFVEIGPAGHPGGNVAGKYCRALTLTDIATDWTVNHSARNKAAKSVFETLQHVIAVFPAPSRGSIRTTAPGSPTNTCSPRTPGSRSPSPDPGLGTRTVACRRSRRTGQVPASQRLPAL